MGFSELANIQNDITGNTILHEVKDTDVILEFFRQNGNPNIAVSFPSSLLVHFMNIFSE